MHLQVPTVHTTLWNEDTSLILLVTILYSLYRQYHYSTIISSITLNTWWRLLCARSTVRPGREFSVTKDITHTYTHVHTCTFLLLITIINEVMPCRNWLDLPNYFTVVGSEWNSSVWRVGVATKCSTECTYSQLQAANFSLKNDSFGRVALCVALPFCCVVVVALLSQHLLDWFFMCYLYVDCITVETLLRTPLGQKLKVSWLVRCPDFRGWIVHKLSIWDSKKCPVYQGVLISGCYDLEGFHCTAKLLNKMERDVYTLMQ